MKITREVKTAILVILGIVFLIFGINYLKGRNLLDDLNTYYADFEYNALTESSPVTIKGNNVGEIVDIKYNFESGKTRVTFVVDEDLKFSKTSVIKMYETGLMGGNAIAIIPGEGGEYAENGDVLQTEVEKGLLNGLAENFSSLSVGLDATLKSADSLLIGLNEIVKDDSERGLKGAIAELNATIKSFRTLSGSFNSLISNNEKGLTSVINNFDSISNDLAVLTSDLRKAELSKTVGDLDETILSLNALVADLDKGEGTLGMLLKDEKLYHNLEVASQQLKELIQDFKLNPKRYVQVSVFGGKNKDDYEKPESERE